MYETYGVWILILVYTEFYAISALVCLISTRNLIVNLEVLPPNWNELYTGVQASAKQ